MLTVKNLNVRLRSLAIQSFFRMLDLFPSYGYRLDIIEMIVVNCVCHRKLTVVLVSTIIKPLKILLASVNSSKPIIMSIINYYYYVSNGNRCV